MDQQTDTPLALVTGASTGIGRALAHEFVEHGFDVVVVADEGRIHDAAADLSTGVAAGHPRPGGPRHQPDALAAPILARMTKPQD